MEIIYNYESCVGLEFDVAIDVQSTRFLTHKKIIAAQSLYFRALFSQGWKQNCISIIMDDGEDAEAIKALIDFCYLEDISMKTVEIFIAANRYLFEQVEAIMIEHFENNVNLGNVLDLVNIPQRTEQSKLQMAINRYCLKNFDSLVKSEKFVLAHEDWLMILISDDNLVAINERTVLEAVWIWYNYDTSEREEAFHRLIHQVRFFRISSKELDRLERSPLKEKLLPYILEARQYKSSRNIFSNSNPKATMKKRSSFAMGTYIFVLGGTNDGNSSLERFNVDSNEWELMAPMERKRNGPQILVVDDSLYAIGGESKFERLKQVERFDVFDNRWFQDSADMQIGRSHFAAIYLDGHIYCLGGLADDGQGRYWRVSKSVERYSLLKNEWSFCASMKLGKFGFNACVHNGRILTFGGLDEYSMTIDSIEAYDPLKDDWYVVAFIPKKPYIFNCCSIGGGKFIFVGGDNPGPEDQFINMYDIETNEWIQVSKTNERRDRLQMINHSNELLYFIGGHNYIQPLSSVEVMDLKTFKCTFKSSMIYPRTAFAAAIYEEK